MSDLQGMQWEPAEQLGIGRVKAVQNKVVQLACRIKGVLQSAQKAILGGMNSTSITAERLN